MAGTTTKEGLLQIEVLLRVGKSKLTRLFRNNIGIANVNGSMIRYGIPGPGGSDLLGWRSVKITKDMVGHTIAQFCACELKTPTGRLSSEQQNFIRVVNDAGGLGVVVRSVRDAEEFLELD